MSVINVCTRTYNDYGLRVLHTGGQSEPGVIPSILIVPVWSNVPVERLAQLVLKANTDLVPPSEVNICPLLIRGVPKSLAWEEYALIVDDSMHDGSINLLLPSDKVRDTFNYRLNAQMLSRKMRMAK